MGGSGGHAIIFEAAGGVLAFVLEKEGAWGHAALFGEQVVLLEESLAFADGDDLVFGGEGE